MAVSEASESGVVLRAVGLGAVWAGLVVALLLLGRAGRSFIYQGF